MKLPRNKKIYAVLLLAAGLLIAWRVTSVLVLRSELERSLDRAVEIRMECMGEKLIVSPDDAAYPDVEEALRGVRLKPTVINPFRYYAINGLLYTVTIQTENTVCIMELLSGGGEESNCLITMGPLRCEADQEGLFKLFHTLKTPHLVVN